MMDTVIGIDTVIGASPVLPPVVYLACTQTDTGEWDPRLCWTDDGRIAILAYTALDRLVRLCGGNQPWVLMPTSLLDALGEHCPHDAILLDAAMPDGHRYQEHGA